MHRSSLLVYILYETVLISGMNFQQFLSPSLSLFLSSPPRNLISRLGNHFLSRILETFPPGRGKRSFQILMEDRPLDYFRFPYGVVCPGSNDRAPEQKKYRTRFDQNSFTSIPLSLYLFFKNLRDYVRSYRLSLKYRVDTLELEKNKKKEKYAINILKSEVNLARVKRCVKRFIIFEVYSCYKF